MTAPSAGGSDRSPGAHPRERGIALVAVLWISALLALLAAAVLSDGRTDIRLAHNMVEMAKAKALADGGVHQALFELSTKSDELVWQRGAVRYRGPVGGGHVDVLIRDDDGRLDVNTISTELWEGLLLAVGVDADGARALADRIVDFRDRDGDAQPLGAEDPDYAAAGYLRGAADRPLFKTSELLDVLGMTSALYERLQPHITVYADVEGVDPARATAISLEALPGMTADMATAIIDSPAGTDPLLAVDDGLTADTEVYLLPSRELIFSIQSTGRSEGGGQFTREATVALDGGSRSLPFTLFAWRRGQASSTGAVPPPSR